MAIQPIALTIRSKKLGVLIRDARQAAHWSIQECSQAIGISEELFDAYELGEQSPSLPELELLAYCLEVPLDHFWGSQARSTGNGHAKVPAVAQILALRQRKIGILVRKARLEAGLSLETLAGQVGRPVDVLQAYEFGEIPIPLPDLEVISSTLHKPLRDFHDQTGLAGAWMNQQRVLQDFQALPPELQAFISKPVNRPYLELAQRFSEMSVEKLRSVAEILLEITF